MHATRLACCLGLVYVSWTVWCVLMISVGAPFDQPIPRAVFRFAAFMVPALVYMWSSEPKDLLRLRLTTNWRSGLTVGIVVAGAWAMLHATQNFRLPNAAHAWVNVITLSPIAEEILFRCIVLERLLTWTSASRAIILSAVLFALIHLPWWWISGQKPAAEIAQLLGVMFAYGVVFGILYHRTRSIWASLLPHSMNNLIAESLVH
jgi:membrane protease YdiL (CAAX protease family)